MRRSNRLLILVGVFLAVLSVVGVIAISGGGGNSGGGGGGKGTPTPTPETKVPVVVAKTDMNLGDKIGADNVEIQQMTVSTRDALPAVPYSSTTEVIGMSVAGTIKKGQVLYADSFLTTGSWVLGKDLAGAIAPGRVAMAVDVDQVSGVGTLLVAGDHVDIVLSLWVEEIKLTAVSDNGRWKFDLGNPEHVTTKMIIQNRKILTVLLSNAGAAAAAQATPVVQASPSAKAKPTSQTITNNGDAHMIVILEVLPEEAEVIRWAQREEQKQPQSYTTMGLVLRSDQDNEAPDVKTLGITFKELVTRYGVLPPDPRGILPADLAKQITW